jgi:hypothetical protein
MEPTPLAGSRRPAGARAARAILTPRGAAHSDRWADKKFKNDHQR